MSSAASWLILAGLTMLATGCGTLAPRAEGSARQPRQASASESTPPLHSAQRPADSSTPARKPGGYYLDDGPLPDPPAELDRIPDAQPRAEPIKASTTRPYTVMGKTYAPMASLAPYTATGIASWYGKRYHGQPTASGERYDMYAMTAAHPILPIPSYARVTNLDSERSVVVKINDRGPFHADRLIDLSYTAAYRLGILTNGSARVRVETIIPDVPELARTPGEGAEPLPAATAALPAARAPATPNPASSGSAVREPIAASTKSPQSLADAASVPITPSEKQAPGVYLQLGAFSLEENAQQFLRRLRVELPDIDTPNGVYMAGAWFRVQAGPYATRDAAMQAAQRIEQVLALKPVIAARP